jgi:hypothetical protein
LVDDESNFYECAHVNKDGFVDVAKSNPSPVQDYKARETCHNSSLQERSADSD